MGRLSSALNADGNGPSKSITTWRKTLKDWKCYVKRKAARIAQQQKQTGGGPLSEEELSFTEEKLGAIGEVGAYGQNSVEESAICGDFDFDISIETVNMDPQRMCLEDNMQNYCGNRKAMKRKMKNSLAEVSEKLISTQNVTNEYKRRIAEVSEKKVALFEMRTSATMEQAVSLKEQKLRQQWRKYTHDMCMKKLQYL